MLEDIGVWEGVGVSLLLIGFMGFWDGIIRRKLRWYLDLQDILISFRGLSAAIIGICLSFLAWGGSVLVVSQVTFISKSICGHQALCTLKNAFSALFINPISFILLISLFFFVRWSTDIFDKEGPYKKYFLSWVSVDNERDFRKYIKDRFQEASLQAPSDDDILHLYGWSRQVFASKWAKDKLFLATKKKRVLFASELLGAFRYKKGLGLDEGSLEIVANAITYYKAMIHKNTGKK